MTAEEKSCRAADNRHAQKDAAALKNISRPSLLIFIHILWWFGRKPLWGFIREKLRIIELELKKVYLT